MAAARNTVRAGARSSLPSPASVPTVNASQQVKIAALLPSRTLGSVNSAIPACIRRDMIEQLAYFKAQERGFAPGHDVEDWLAAEIEVDNLIRERYR